MRQSPTAVKPQETKSMNVTLSSQSRLRFGKAMKALLDYFLVIPGLFFISPLLFFIAALIKLETPGPVIYRRKALGKNGRIFYAYKFRTMYIDGYEKLAQQPGLRAELYRNYKLELDPRVTRIGYFLRKFNLDELPQLFNILQQDMSLVGPRIIAPHELRKYGQWGDTLLSVSPGLTGLWQVSGRSNLSYDERIRLDMAYIHNWTIGLDIRIILQTVPVVLKGDGLY